MATQITGISALKPFQYMECFWGESITGAKPQLQALGLGVGLAFPGEAGAPKRVLRVVDPRGLSARITRDYDGQRYCAQIEFPGRNRPKRDDWESFAPGVRKQCHCYADYFVGTASALTDAGLLEAHQFPGMPGMRKVRVTILADGSVPTGAPNANVAAKLRNSAGCRTVERAGVNTYRVAVNVDEDLRQLRFEAHRAHDDQWMAQMWALPRPPRLTPIAAFAAGTPNSIRCSSSTNTDRTPLFELNPAGAMAKEMFEQHAMKTLRELVEFSQESVYDAP